MSYGPYGISHFESGKCALVKGAVTGDVVEASIAKDKKNVSFCNVEKIVEPSPMRVTPPADSNPSLAPWGCLEYRAQLEAKEKNVRRSFRNVAHLDESKIDSIFHPIEACKDEWGYRNKLEMASFEGASGRFSLGFHEEGEDGLVEDPKCPLANRLISKAPKSLTGAIRRLSGNEDLGIFRVGVRGSLATKDVEIALWTEPSPFPRGFAAKMLKDALRASSVVRVIADTGSARRVKRCERLDGKGFWEELLCGRYKMRVSAPSFFQVNTRQAAKLVDLALDEMRKNGVEEVADLYCGVGTFSIPMADAGLYVAGIELSGPATRDLRANCEANGVDVDVICDDVARALPELGAFDAAVIDPPRAGIDKRALQAIADCGAKMLIYVSCDPQTLARDIDRLREHGFRLESATPVDMFPQTFHVETVCTFKR